MQRACDVVIQGAGIGGLTLAIALQGRGYSVQVVERCGGLSEIGAGIWMAPNAMQVFERLGIAQEVIRAGWPIRLIRLQDSRGFDLQVTDLGKFKQEFTFENTALHRVVLQRLLMERVEPETILFGVEIKELDDRAGAPLSVGLSSGGSLHARLVVGADGINSGIRRQIAFKGEKRYSGSSSYRGVACGAGLPPFGSEYDAYEIWGEGCRMGFSHINQEDVYWWMTFDAPAGETTTAEEAYAHAASLFRTVFPRWNDLLERTAPDSILRTDIADLSPLDVWSKGRTGLLGDAAHAATPNLGQGGAMAVEDAFAFAEAVGSCGLNEAAWKRFEAGRRAKVDWTVSTSRALGRIGQLRNPVARAVRNMLVRSTPQWIGERQIRLLYTVA